MQVDARYAQLNERLEQVNGRLRAALFDSFAAIEQSALRVAARCAGFEADARLAADFSADLLAFFKRKRFELQAEAEVEQWGERIAAAAKELARLDRVVANLQLLLELAAEGELLLAIGSWRKYRARQPGVARYAAVAGLLRRFDAAFEQLAAQRSREHLQLCVAFFARSLPRWELATRNAAVGGGAPLGIAALSLRFAENRDFYAALGRADEGRRLLHEQLEERLNEVALSNLEECALSTKLLEIFAFLALHARLRREVFAERLPEFDAARDLQPAFARLEKRIRASDREQLAAVITLLSFLSERFLAERCARHFLLFGVLLECAILQYVERSAAELFAASDAAPFELIVAASAAESDEMAALGLSAESQSPFPRATAVCDAFRAVARLFPRFLAALTTDRNLESSLRKLPAHADHGIDFLARLALAALRKRLSTAALTIAQLIGFAHSLARLDADVLPRFFAHKSRRSRALSESLAALASEAVEQLIVGLKRELETAVRAFAAANCAPTRVAAPNAFLELVGELQRCNESLTRSEGSLLLLQVVGCIDQTLVDVLWKFLVGSARAVSVADLRALAADIAPLTAFLKRLQTAASAPIVLYHEEIARFCELFLRGELPADAAALAARLPHTDLRVVRRVLAKFEEGPRGETPFVSARDVRRLAAALPQ